VIADGELAKRPWNLISARDAGARDPVRGDTRDLAAAEFDMSGVGTKMAAHDVDQRRLAGTVRPEESQHFALADLERDAAQRLHAFERLVEPLDDEQGRCCDASRHGGVSRTFDYRLRPEVCLVRACAALISPTTEDSSRHEQDDEDQHGADDGLAGN